MEFVCMAMCWEKKVEMISKGYKISNLKDFEEKDDPNASLKRKLKKGLGRSGCLKKEDAFNRSK